MPVGYVVTMVLAACCTAIAIRPTRPERSSPSNLSFWFGFLVNELPFAALVALAASTALAAAEGDLATPLGWVGAAVAVAVVPGLVVITIRGLRAREALDTALAAAAGPDERARRSVRRRRRPWLRILFGPLPWRPHDVERIPNLAYGGTSRVNRLDLYRPRGRRPDGPTLVYLHGGAFRGGSRRREGRPMLHRLARRGWVCVSADYRLVPEARFPDQLVDAKRVIAWVREHGSAYGADATDVIIAGSSSGAHLASTAALTAGEAAFQPGFEDADTSVSAAIALYGYFGTIDTAGPPSSPHDHVHAGAPPFLVVHGGLDTIVVPQDARDFVRHLGATSSNPVVYAELPGAQHDFDLVHSIRSEAVIDAVERFATSVTARST